MTLIVFLGTDINDLCKIVMYFLGNSIVEDLLDTKKLFILRTNNNKSKMRNTCFFERANPLPENKISSLRRTLDNSLPREEKKKLDQKSIADDKTNEAQ